MSEINMLIARLSRYMNIKGAATMKILMTSPIGPTTDSKAIKKITNVANNAATTNIKNVSKNVTCLMLNILKS